MSSHALPNHRRGKYRAGIDERSVSQLPYRSTSSQGLQSAAKVNNEPECQLRLFVFQHLKSLRLPTRQWKRLRITKTFT